MTAPLRAAGEADRAAILRLMQTRAPDRHTLDGHLSFRLGEIAFPDMAPVLAQPWAARTLKGLRAEGKVECLGTNGVWRLVEGTTPNPSARAPSDGAARRDGA